MLKLFLSSTVMTFVTTTLTRLYKVGKDNVYFPSPRLESRSRLVKLM